MFLLLHFIINLVISVSAVQLPVYHLLETLTLDFVDFRFCSYCLLLFIRYVIRLLFSLKSLRSKHDKHIYILHFVAVILLTKIIFFIHHSVTAIT